MVSPADIGRVGALGACILALVRYVTALPGESDRRRLVDGETWWRGSQDDIGQLLGDLHRKSVGRALLKLEVTGELLSTPSKDYGDRAKLYRAPDQPLDGSGQSSDQPLDDSGQSIGRKCPFPSAGSGQSDWPKVANLPISEELEEEEREKAGAAEPAEALDVETVPGNGNAPPPPDSSEDQSEPLDGVDDVTVLDGQIVEPVSDPRPEPKCRRHPDGDVGEPCRACKRDNDAIEAWQQRQKEVALLRILSSVAESPRTERPPSEPKPPAPSWIHGTYGPRCPRHGHLKVPPSDCSRCDEAAIAARESA